jgi:hypothetical protein
MARLIVVVLIIVAGLLAALMFMTDWSMSTWRENRRMSRRQLIVDDNYRAWQRAVWAVQLALYENDQLLLGMSTETVEQLRAVIKEFRSKELSDGKGKDGA